MKTNLPAFPQIYLNFNWSNVNQFCGNSPDKITEIGLLTQYLDNGGGGWIGSRHYQQQEPTMVGQKPTEGPTLTKGDLQTLVDVIGKNCAMLDGE